jgi:adenosine deaminase
VNSDDPAYFRAYVNENLEALAGEGGPEQKEIVQLVRNAFIVAWIDEPRRSHYLATVQSYVARA